MAPEQARGKPVDKRADIWAFGVVVYEMLTGRRPFDGEDVSTTLAAVIQSEPRWDGCPPQVRRLLKKCLKRIRAGGCATSAMSGSCSTTRRRPLRSRLARLATVGWIAAGSAGDRRGGRVVGAVARAGAPGGTPARPTRDRTRRRRFAPAASGPDAKHVWPFHRMARRLVYRRQRLRRSATAVHAAARSAQQRRSLPVQRAPQSVLLA